MHPHLLPPSLYSLPPSLTPAPSHAREVPPYASPCIPSKQYILLPPAPGHFRGHFLTYTPMHMQELAVSIPGSPGDRPLGP